ncbi:hypothetical protein Syun_031593 [Stephania yunnanensis]|uniref:SSD domain-containing protein n=1 Tax=Stephania yunnanensis TaxID=152371 RepID=A0AAP0DWA3_9MAGN
MTANKHYTSAETCRSAFQSPLDHRTVLGGFSGANYSEASAFLITYPVNNEVDQAGSGNGKAVAWEQDFIEVAKVLLGFSGVFLIMLAVLGSIGFFSAIGVKSTLITMEVIHFLVLAVSYFS